MKCPICPESQLVMTERQGIEIDYCPNCRGVWLDRGELDKIIERTEQASVPPPQNPVAYPPQQYGYEGDYRSGRSEHHGGQRGFLKNLFD